MKKAIFAAVLMAGTLGFAASALADPVLGVWKTKPDDNGNFGHVQIKRCGANVCGTLVKAFNASGKEIASPNIGRSIVKNMKPYADGFYDDGEIYSPDRDKTYNGDMTLKGNSLSVRGCVLMICRDGGTWTRVK